MTPSLPTVSVVIPSYDRRATLPAAIASARTQTCPPHEIIVVDDHSTDGTAEALVASNPDVRLIRLPRRSGACAARNAGAATVTGSHIAFLDSDDVFLPDKLEKQLRALATTGARFATCGLRLPSGKALLTRALPEHRLATFNFRGGTSGLLVETGLMREVGFDPRMLAVQDWDVFLRLGDRAPGVHVPEALYLYGLAEANRITRSKRRRLLGHVQLYRKVILGTTRDTLRARLVHRALQASLAAHLQGRPVCWRLADVLHQALR